MTDVVHLDEVRDIPFTLEPPPAVTHSWQPASLITLAENPPAPPTIGGLLYPAKRTVLSGETESMKTWLALILCKAELDIGLPVGWVDLDAMGPGALLERLTLLGVEPDVVHQRFHYIQPSEMLDPAKITDVVDLIESQSIRLFVIDAFNPILSLHGLEPNSTPDIETFWRTIADPIANAGAAPVLLDHVVKNSEARGKYSYGSERKASGAIVHLGFRLLEPLTKGGRGRTLLTVHKDRPGYLPRPTLGRLVITSENDTISYTLDPDKSHDETGGFRPTILMERVSRQLEIQAEPVSTTWVTENVQGNAAALKTALRTLVDDGYTAIQPGPKKASLHTSIRPYREAEDTPNPTPSSPRPHPVLNLRSSPSPSPSYPLWGTGSDEDPQGIPVQTPSPSSGQPIHEYDFPPIDESTAPDPDWQDE